jgi:hypothetical protein
MQQVKEVALKSIATAFALALWASVSLCLGTLLLALAGAILR